MRDLDSLFILLLVVGYYLFIFFSPLIKFILAKISTDSKLLNVLYYCSAVCCVVYPVWLIVADILSPAHSFYYPYTSLNTMVDNILFFVLFCLPGVSFLLVVLFKKLSRRLVCVSMISLVSACLTVSHYM